MSHIYYRMWTLELAHLAANPIRHNKVLSDIQMVQLEEHTHLHPPAPPWNPFDPSKFIQQLQEELEKGMAATAAVVLPLLDIELKNLGPVMEERQSMLLA